MSNIWASSVTQSFRSQYVKKVQFVGAKIFSDVSAFQNPHTVVKEPKNATRVLSSMVNEDGTITYMVTAEPEHSAIDDKTVVFLRISDGNEETT